LGHLRIFKAARAGQSSWGLGDFGTWRLWDLGTWGLGDLGTWGLGDLGTWGLGDLGTWGLGDLGTWGLEVIFPGLEERGMREARLCNSTRKRSQYWSIMSICKLRIPVMAISVLELMLVSDILEVKSAVIVSNQCTKSWKFYTRIALGSIRPIIFTHQMNQWIVSSVASSITAVRSLKIEAVTIKVFGHLPPK
jgi:hypothetical protein